MATSICINITRENPRIIVKAGQQDPRDTVVVIGADLVFLSDHQAYELEAALCRERMRRTYREIRPGVHVPAEMAADWPIPAEAATGCEVDTDDLVESMAMSYEVRRDQAGATNCPKEVP